MKCLVSALVLSAGSMLYAAEADLGAAIAKHRTGPLVIRAKPGAKITVEQLKHDFWFGATLPGGIFSGNASPEDVAKFNEVFATHFNAGVVESAFKWHDMEKERGLVNYSIVDRMLAWASQHDIPLRGHCIFWGIPNRVMDWQKALGDTELRQAVEQRGKSIGARYAGKFFEYDLNNEMIHADYYRDRFGPDFPKQMALWVKSADPNAVLYFNDYDILTGNRLNDYVKDIRRLLDAGAPMDGIGVQGHLHGDSFDPAALQNALDVLAQFKLPIRVTEFNFPGQRSKYYTGDRKAQLTPAEEQAKAAALKQYYQICFAHPAVTGIMMWGFWEGANWIPQSSLYKRDWSPTPAAETYQDLVLKQWWTRWSGTADKQGQAVVNAFYGTYRVTVDGKSTIVNFPKSAGAKLIDID
jgi:endo-1,4-beta-xylanase